MAFYFAEHFGTDHAAQHAEIGRLAQAGQLRRDAVLKARALKMLIIQPSGKPQRGEPQRIARALSVSNKRVSGWIYDVQGQVDYLVEHGRVSRVQAWAQLKNVWVQEDRFSWAAVERGIRRSLAGRNAGRKERRRSGW